MAISHNLSHDAQALPHAPGLRLRHGTGMLAAAVVLALVFNAANLPTPLYVIYRDRFHFSEITLTLIFAAYVVGAMSALLFFGRLSDQIGRRPVLFASTAFSGASALLFLFAFGTPMLFVARVVSGFGAGLTASACAAWIAELAPKNDKSIAALMTSGANVAGLALGPLIAGVLAQYAPMPLRLPYLIYLIGLAPPALLVLVIEETVTTPKRLREVSLKPRVGVPADILGEFIAPAVTAFVAFALMGFYSSLVPSLIRQSLKISSHAIGGAVIFYMFACGLGAIAASRLIDSRAAMFSALGLLIPGVLLLVAARDCSSMALLLAASALGGASGALGYRGSLAAVNEIAPQDRRAETLAVLFLVCYAGISVPVIGIGVLSRFTSAVTADLVFAVVLCVLALVAAVMGVVYGGQKKRQRSG